MTKTEKERKKRVREREAKNAKRRKTYAEGKKVGNKAAANQRKKRRMLKEAGLP